MQTLVLKGQIKGQTIVLEQPLNLPDGTPVRVEVYPLVSPEAQTQREQALQRILSMGLPVDEWEQMEDEIIHGAIRS
ncbi:MAG: hypothetical protein ABDI19_12435 [Armatimonadota bacterium]